MTEQQSNFLKFAIPLAQAAARRWGVPASITVAQAILESAWGQSQLAREANNFFGVKAAHLTNPSSYIELPTTEVVNSTIEHVDAAFARYETPRESFYEHGWLLATASRYRPAMAAAGDVRKFANELYLCGYSTNPHYGAELARIVDLYDLTAYDAPPADPAATAQPLKPEAGADAIAPVQSPVQEAAA